MSTYRMSDGTVVRTENASARYSERCWHDGKNWISCATGAQWAHERLCRSRRGRYYVVSTSDWQGSHASAEWVSREEAARWLSAQDIPLPKELRALEATLTE
jgi:hypothetical protein